MNPFIQQAEDYQKIETAIHYLEDHFKEQPSLDQIARNVHMSKYHFSRIFKRWAGVSPGQFLQFLTLNYTKQCLSDSKSVLSSALDAGLSGPGRLHDLFVTFDAISPGEFKAKGKTLVIEYGQAHSPFGRCLAARTHRGICHLSFFSDTPCPDLDQLKAGWPFARFRESKTVATELVHQIFSDSPASRPFHLDLKGTNFQIKVWQALLNLPSGCLASYQDIARFIGNPAAVRAVANAVAINPVAYLIPCHRVIAKSGNPHQYRWGAARKKALIGWEAALKNSQIA